VSDLLQWFGEQSEAVKLGILGLLGGISAGFWGVMAAWRKPVLAAVPTGNTTVTAPRSADDPVMMLLNEVSAMNVTLAALLAASRDTETGQNERIEKVVDHIKELTNELYLLRNSLNNRPMGN